MSASSLPLWIQVGTVVIAPMVALVGVGIGARLTRSGEEIHWLRDARLKAYTVYLLACNSYDVAARQLEQSLRHGHYEEQTASREAALKAIREVLAYRESVLLLGSSDVRARCQDVTDAVYAQNESTRRLIEGADDDREGPARELSTAIESFRAAVRAELLPRRIDSRREGARLGI
jgi:hypothetical protein